VETKTNMEMIGLLLPIVIDLVNRKVENSDIRFWVSVAVCSAVGGALNYLDTSYTFASPVEAFESVTGSIMMVFGLAQISYQGFYENSKLRKSITN
jgi:hypothetical protein